MNIYENNQRQKDYETYTYTHSQSLGALSTSTQSLYTDPHALPYTQEEQKHEEKNNHPQHSEIPLKGN